MQGLLFIFTVSLVVFLVNGVPQHKRYRNAFRPKYYSAEYLDSTAQSSPSPLNLSTGASDYYEGYMENDETNDSMETFFNENDFVEINNDEYYPPVSTSNNTSGYPSYGNHEQPDKDNHQGVVIEEQFFYEAGINQQTSIVNSTNQTDEVSMEEGVTDENTESPVEVENTTDSGALSENHTDQVIAPFIHPIHRPSNEWPLKQTQQGSRRPVKKPVRTQPQVQKKRRRRRRKGSKKPVPGQSGNKRRTNQKKPQNNIPVRNPSSNSNKRKIASCGSCQCGVTTTRLDSTGGSVVATNEFPWLALISYNQTIQCAGTLINDRYVLTAAHCVRGFDIKEFQIRFLEYDHEASSSTVLLVRNVARIISLDTYQANTGDNDIAMVKLSKPIKFSTTTIRPICLPSSKTDFVGQTGTISGWGVPSEDGQTSTIIRKSKVPIISNRQCLLVGMKLTDNMMCAGRLLAEEINGCEGDSGGPLMVVHEKRYYLAGVVSWGDGCARPMKPGIYARVTKYLPWIKKSSAGLCTCH